MSSAKRLLIIALATGCGAGFFPVAPGTVGTLVGLAVWYLCGPLSIPLQLLLLAGLVLVGAWVSQSASVIFGKVDSGQVVIDEIAGVVVTMLGVPHEMKWLLPGFLLFRVFDIVKPPPAGWCDRNIKNGWGVMADDLVAGLYANLLMQLIVRVGS